jgi:uncharacterized protein (TIGR03435 family)
MLLRVGGTVRNAAFAMLLSAAVSAQSPVPTFEVASVRPSAGEPIGASSKFEGNTRFSAEGATLRDLIVRAYSVQGFQVVTGDPWMSKARFDVNARAEGASSATILTMMLRTLLAERFGLTVRHETKQGPVYSLTVDGPLRPAMQRSSMDCRDVNEDRDLCDASPVPPARESCQPQIQFVVGPTGARVTLSRPGITTKQLAAILAPFARRIVVDRTDLQGTFDVRLTVSPESAVMVTQDSTIVAPQAEGLSVATAVREQLGLRLRAAEGPTETVIVEQAHAPTAD